MRSRLLLGALAYCAAAWGQAAPAAQPAQTGSRPLVLQASPGQTSYLGIGVQEIDAERAKALNLKEERGAEVTSVEQGSPAAKAGLQEHDVVLEYNGQAVEGTEQLTRLVRETPPDRQVKIKVWREGKTETLTATVGTRPSGFVTPGEIFSFPGIRVTPPQIDIPSFQMNWQNPRLGIVGEALGQEPQFADWLGVKEGVLVKSVVKDSAAEKAGIKAGDVVVKVEETPVKSTTDINRTLRDSNKTSVTVTVVRNKKEMPLTVNIENPTRSRTRGATRAVRATRV